MFAFTLLCFVSLFTMVNPISIIPVFNSMTASLTPKEVRRVALRASITALITLIFFALTGQFVFKFFQISIHSFRLVGGVIFFIMGYEMLQARLTRTNYDEQTTRKQYMQDIAITPLGIPMICGPGAITTIIVLMNQGDTLVEQSIVIGVTFLIVSIVYVALISGNKILKLVGDSGNKVVLRLMGLIEMVIAVEWFFAGLKPILRDIFKIH